MLRQTLILAARAGGAELLKYFGKVAADRKVDGSLVTEADLASERAIIAEIEKVYPNCSFIAEESGFLRRSSSITVVIDPLDGTSNFACGLPWFGVLITALSLSEPIAAVMYLPALDVIYDCEKDSALFRNQELILPDENRCMEKLITICFDPSSAQTPEREKLLHLTRQFPSVGTTSSLFDYAYFLDGHTSGFVFASGTSSIWDVAGLPLMMRATGRVVSDLEGCPLNLQPDEEALTNSFPVLASSPRLHTKMIAFMQSLPPRGI